MRVLLPRIPTTVTKNQLTNFASEVLARKFTLPFTSKPCLDSCEILCVTGQHSTIEHHGLVSITPEPAAHWFIKNARGKMLGNKRVLAREYLDRKGTQVDYPDESDRRDPHSSVEKVQENRIEVEGLEQFKRTYD